MRAGTIRRHLAPYSMTAKRKTTVRHMFASALALGEPFDETRVIEALRIVGQNDPNNLTCTYCGKEAQTWDHLEALVRDSRPSGHGHLIGNLVPSCKDCNSRKGNKSWKEWMQAENISPVVIRRVSKYQSAYGGRTEWIKVRRVAADLRRLEALEEDILEKMAEADALVKKIRETSKRR